MKQKKLIFFQSMAEISEIIEIIEQSSFGKCIILVTGGKHFMPILNRLKLNITYGAIIFEFHWLTLKNPINLIKMFYRFHYSYDAKKVMSFKYEKAYFFNQYIDFVAPIFLNKCEIDEIICIDFYKSKFVDTRVKIGIKENIRKYLIIFLQRDKNILLKYTTLISMRHNLVLFFDLIGKKIYKEFPKSKNNYSFFKLPLKANLISKKKIIYLDSYDEYYFGKSYNEVISSIFDIAKQVDYHIVISKHSRVNLSPSLKLRSRCSYIDDPVPVQLYDLSNVDFIIGYFSSGLPAIADKYPNIKVISIVRLNSKKKLIEYDELVDYHNRLSAKNNILYPDSIKKLREIIEKYDSDIH